MQAVPVAGPCAGRAPALLVLLPGAYSEPQEFIDEGYVQALRDSRAACDVSIAAAHLGYYIERNIIDRLRADIVLPARAAGYRQVWLAGISIGGFGALGYALRHPGEITGVLAIAPYLGRRTLLQEIAAAGGPQRWRAGTPRPDPADDDLERELWWWLAGGAAPTTWLGYGRDDRFADAHRVAADLLGPDRSFSVPGGHDWPAWRPLWQQWLARGLLPSACA